MTEKFTDVDAEGSVLGGMLLSDTVDWPDAVDLLSPGDFAVRHHSTIFEAMIKLRDSGKPANDVIAIQAVLGGSSPEGGWPAYLADLWSRTPSAANLEHYAKIVAERARARCYLRILNETISGLKKGDCDQVATQAATELGKVSERGVISRPTTVSQLVREELKDIEDRARRGDTVIGLPTGFQDLDEQLSGLIDENLIIIAGRPSMGKSSLLRSMLFHNAKLGNAGLMFSLEMSGKEIIQNAIGDQANINTRRIRNAKLNKEHWRAFVGAAGELDLKNLYLDTTTTDIDRVRLVARAHVARHGVKVIGVDYLQLLSTSTRTSADKRVHEVSEISRKLKLLAQELSVPVIALSQLNRSAEMRVDKRPQMYDLRESGAIEQDANTIILIYRDQVYHPPDKKDEPDIAEISIAKQRSGATGVVRLRFVKEFARFETPGKYEFGDKA